MSSVIEKMPPRDDESSKAVLFRRAKQAEIRRLNAEASNLELEARWHKGWRSMIKPIVAGLASVSAIWFYADFYMEGRLKLYEQKKDNAEFVAEQAREEGKQLVAKSEEARSELAKLKGQLEQLQGERNILVAKTDELKNKGANYERLLQEYRETVDAYKKKEGSTKQEQNLLKQKQLALMTELDAAKKKLEDAAKGPSVAVNASPGTAVAEGVVASVSAPSIHQREASLEILLSKYEGKDDFILAKRVTDDRMEKERKHAHVPNGEKSIAAINFVFGDSLVFGLQGIYYRGSGRGSWFLSYLDLAQRQYVKKGIWNIDLASGQEISLAGTSFKRADLLLLLEATKELVQNNLRLFEDASLGK